MPTTHRWTPTLLVAASLLLAGAAFAATSRVTTLSNATTDTSQWMEAFDPPTAGLGDFDGDGVPELVQQNDNQYAYVMRTTTSDVVAEFRPPYPAHWGVRPLNSPVVADVDFDGNLDIVLVTSAAQVCRYEYNPAGSTSTHFDFTRKWCHRMDAFDDKAASDSPAYLADVNGDGDLEIFANTEERGIYAFNRDGTVRWKNNDFAGNAGPLVTDLEKDGKKDVLFFGDGGEVRAYDASSGAHKWTFFSSKYVWPASIPVAGNAADLDNDGTQEVVFTARHAEHTDDYQKNNLMLFVLDHRGGIEWRVQPTWAHPLSYTHPILEDLNGDGKKDILLQDWNTIGHKPGNWEQLGKANVFAYKHDGTLLWRTQLDNSWSNDDLALGDVDGDGVHEVLAIGFAASGEDGIWYLDSRTGAKEQHVGVGSGWTILRGPVMGNLDGSGKLSWAISVHSTDRGGAFQVFRTDASCLMKFGGWQNRYGCDGLGGGGGTGGQTGGGDTGGDAGSGTFDATFNSPSGNEWWIQVGVDANAALQSVDARVNGGTWKPLALKSWGDWAGSYHAPEGSLVQFRAKSTSGEYDFSVGGWRWTAAAPYPAEGAFDVAFHNAGGDSNWVQVNVYSNEPIAGVAARLDGGSWRALDLKSWGDWANAISVSDGTLVQFRATGLSGASETSGCHQWPHHTETACDGSGSTGGGTVTFDATFNNPSGNEWWLQVGVDSSRTISAVHASIDGGAWKPLELKSWGDWAKSYHAPEGSIVQFRATASDGAQTHSGCYEWTAATATTCSGAGGGTDGGAFDATFANARGNEWWIEVDASASGGTLQTVDARINGGSWKPLEKTDWSSWAKSYHAPSGSTVEFRATSAGGETDVSGAYSWPPS